jgi:hypothetical protein
MRLFLVVSLVLLASPAIGAGDFCSKWNRAGPKVKESAVRQNLQKYPPGKFDLYCAMNKSKHFVQWTNGHCRSGMSFSAKTYAGMLLEEAQKVCPDS